MGRSGLLRQIHAAKLVVAATMLKSASTICQPLSNDGGSKEMRRASGLLDR